MCERERDSGIERESTLNTTINNENPPYQICSVHNPAADPEQNYSKDGSENEKEYNKI